MFKIRLSVKFAAVWHSKNNYHESNPFHLLLKCFTVVSLGNGVLRPLSDYGSCNVPQRQSMKLTVTCVANFTWQCHRLFFFGLDAFFLWNTHHLLSPKAGPCHTTQWCSPTRWADLCSLPRFRKDTVALGGPPPLPVPSTTPPVWLQILESKVFF